MSTADREGPRAKIPLRFVLIVPFVVQVTLVAGLVGYLSFHNGQRAVNDFAHQLRGEITAHIKEHLRVFLATPHKINQINASAIRQGVPEPDDLDALERYFWEQIQVFHSVTSIFFGNPEGGLVDAGREGAEGSLYVIVTDEFKRGPFRKYATDSEGNRTELLSTIPNFDARTRAWYTDAVEAGGPIWTDTYILFTGQDMAISASRPVYDEQHNLLGVVSNSIFTSHISNFLSGIKVGKTGSSFIVERSGMLIASSTEEKPFTDLDNGEGLRRLHASESASPAIRRAAEFLTEQFGDYHNITGEQALEFEIDGQRQFLQVAPIRDDYGIDWLAVVIIPESDLIAHIKAGNRTTVYLIGVALIVAIVVGVVTAQWVTAPILRLNASTQALAEGQWDQTISGGWIGEISALARSFNDMVGRLKQSMESLTTEIAERKQIERALRVSEAKYRSLIEQSEDAIYLLYEGKFEVINPKFEELFGLTPEEAQAPGFDFRRLVAPQSRPVIEERSRKLATGEELSSRYEFTALDKKGDEIEVEVSVSYVPYKDGTATQGILRDVTERKRAERELERRRQQWDALMANTPDLVYFKDDSHRMIRASQAYADIFGVDAEDLVGKTALELWPEEGEDIMADERRVLSGEPIIRKEREVTAPTDESKWYLLTKIPIYEDGDVVGFFAIDKDVTERKRVEKALREERDRAQKYLDIAGVMIVALNTRGDVTLINRQGVKILGYEREEIIGKNWFDNFLPADVRGDVRTIFDTLMAGEIEPQAGYENPIVTKEGEERVIIWHNTLLRDDQGQITGSLSSGNDVTARKQAEQERERLLAQIQQQARQMEQILATVPEGVLLLDAEGRVQQVNPTGEKDLALLSGAKVGSILTHLGNRPLEELLTSPPTKGLWHEVKSEDRTFEVIARPMQNKAEPENWVLVLRDVTEEREIEQRTRQQERLVAVGQLAAGVAHDFNNIMATIVLYAQMMSRMEDLPARSREQLAMIDSQAKQASELIQQILDFSRRSVLERKPLDLMPLLKEQVKLLERTLPENIQVDLTYGHGEYTVNADPTRIQQVVMNLAVNARDAMPEGGTLSIGLERITVERSKLAPLPDMEAGDWIQLTVTDTGKGISADALSHIFEPFFTTKGPGRGSGLGLAQVHGIVKQHDGHIDVESRMDQGTTFTIYLPAMPVQPPKPHASHLAELARGHGETILVVEDNVDTRQALVDTLEGLGYRTIAARNGEEAMKMLENASVALVLSDVVMPKMGGIALLHALRERELSLPMVLLTGHPLEEEIEGLRDEGLNNWLFKPPSLVELAEVVSRALDQ